MKPKIIITGLISALQLLALGDTLVLNSGVEVSGTVVHTYDNGDLLLLTDNSTYHFSRTNLKEIKFGQIEDQDYARTDRLPTFKQVVRLLVNEPWASDMRQIPATVINEGMLKNVPYVSFRCSDDYEVNVYGDLSHPAGIEAGVYRGLLTNSVAKNNCIRLVGALLSQQNDKMTASGLKIDQDLQHSAGLTFEITPPSAPDAYQGWWIAMFAVHTTMIHMNPEDDRKTTERGDERLKCSKCGHEFYCDPGWIKTSVTVGCQKCPEVVRFKEWE